MNRIIIVKGRWVSVQPSLVERVQHAREQGKSTRAIAENERRTAPFITALVSSIEDEAQLSRVG